MKKLTLNKTAFADAKELTRAEMKNVMGGGCPAWYQAQCIATAANAASEADSGDEDAVYNMIMSICMSEYTSMPDNP
ncbi:hypothetical protein [Pedobacter frigiditerrae]|uniref:hypothetical protein n=1 Tax=Pedobacter frigiditerrae TaxID=2530452 RepID=UPI0029309F9F|nr:hypothetical protein [Pedobacter frigiditerrae]